MSAIMGNYSHMSQATQYVHGEVHDPCENSSHMSSQDTQAALRRALYIILRPMARIILRHGLAYGTFAEIVRKAFVDESFAELKRDGQRTSISSVAAMTGLTRKEAKRLVDYDVESNSDANQRYNRALRVVAAWAVNPRFINDEGAPRRLPLDGDGSFAELVRDFSGDMTPAAMLTILEKSDTVAVRDGAVELLSRVYLPTQTPASALIILGNDVAQLVTSIDHNLRHEQPERVFQRSVYNTSVHGDAVAAFRELSNKKSQELLEEYDSWLAEHEVGATEEETANPHHVSVGIFYCDSTLQEDPMS